MEPETFVTYNWSPSEDQPRTAADIVSAASTGSSILLKSSHLYADRGKDGRDGDKAHLATLSVVNEYHIVFKAMIINGLFICPT